MPANTLRGVSSRRRARYSFYINLAVAQLIPSRTKLQPSFEDLHLSYREILSQILRA